MDPVMRGNEAREGVVFCQRVALGSGCRYGALAVHTRSLLGHLIKSLPKPLCVADASESYCFAGKVRTP